MQTRTKTLAALVLALGVIAFTGFAQDGKTRVDPVANRTFTGSGASMQAATDAAIGQARQAAMAGGLADYTVSYVVEEISGRAGGLMNTHEVAVRIRIR